MQLPVPDPAAAPPQADAELRRRTITALADLIYGRGDGAAAPDVRAFRPEHDPALRRRSEAVELLGRFPDAEAAAVLSDLVLRGERDLPAPVGRWLRDTALLTLLRSHRLPPGAVDNVLRRTYSIARHPLPWQWSAVYDDLPLLARYGKLGLFFRVFWLWPLLVLALAPLGLIGQMLKLVPVGSVGGGGDLTIFSDLFILLGTGLEIYLIHQVMIALLAGRLGPLLRVPQVSLRWKAAAGAVLALLVMLLLVLMVGLIVADTVATGEGRPWFLFTTLVLPVLLLPMFILAHDLEVAIRYAPRRQSRGIRLWATLLRRMTDFIYIFLLPVLGSLVWYDQVAFGPATLGLLAYLFAVPLIVTGGLTLLKRLLRGGTPARTMPGA
jgi:hypothetical protein